MQVEFQTAQEDYKVFLKQLYFQKDLGKRFFLLVIFSALIGTLREQGQPFEVSSFIIKFIISGLVLFCIGSLIPFLISRSRLQKALDSKSLTERKTLTIQQDGISINSENENSIWNWETLKSANITDRYLYVTLFTKKFYVIPLSSFSSENESINFLGVLKNGILKVRGQSQQRKVHNLYYLGLIGIIPNFGAIAGVYITIMGFNYKNPKLIALGIGCILFTVIFWTFLSPLILNK